MKTCAKNDGRTGRRLGILHMVLAGWLGLCSGRAPAADLTGVEAVFDRPQLLAEAHTSTVCILDTEHPDVVREKVQEKGIDLYKCRVLKRRVEELTELPCVLVHYSEVSWKEFDNPHVQAILLMAQKYRMNNRLQEALSAFLRRNRTPLIGFCGGQQMICEAFGGVTAPMRDLTPGEPDTNLKYYPGRFKEWGFLPVRIVARDPIFAGFDATLTVKEMHAFEVTRLPPEFELLASTDECRLEMVKHRERLLYGTQFHPEAFDDEHPDGRRLLQNFFHLAGIGQAAASGSPNPEADPLAGTGGLFDEYPRFTPQSPPVVCLVTTQDPAEIRAAIQTPDGMRKLLTLKARVEELSGRGCLLAHYLQLGQQDLEKPNIRAIVLSSWKVPKEPRHAAELDALLRQTQKPLIAFCGGHSLLYTACGGRAAAMCALRPGEADPYPQYFPGEYKEWGFLPVRIVARDPIFDHLGDEIVVCEKHYAECKQMPPDFLLLASSPECKVQVIKHCTRPVYGTQFHPEAYDDEHPDGKILLKNFFRLAGCRD